MRSAATIKSDRAHIKFAIAFHQLVDAGTRQGENLGSNLLDRTVENLKPCRDCKTMVSPSAQNCPKCGRQHPSGTPIFYRFAQAIAVIFGLMIAVSFISSVSQPSEKGQMFDKYADDAESGLNKIGEAAQRAHQQK